MSCQNDEREAVEGRCVKVSAVDGSSPLQYQCLRAIREPKVRDERTGERCRGSGKITTGPSWEKELAPAECGRAANGSSGGAPTHISLQGCPLPEGECQREKTAQHQLEQAASGFAPRAHTKCKAHVQSQTQVAPEMVPQHKMLLAGLYLPAGLHALLCSGSRGARTWAKRHAEQQGEPCCHQHPIVYSCHEPAELL